jgi:hypothetical protein
VQTFFCNIRAAVAGFHVPRTKNNGIADDKTYYTLAEAGGSSVMPSGVNEST